MPGQTEVRVGFKEPQSDELSRSGSVHPQTVPRRLEAVGRAACRRLARWMVTFDASAERGA